jgi:hypothetical protein
MTTPTNLQLLDSADETAALSLKEKLLADPESFRPDYLAGKRWTVVPVESASHFGERDVRLLAAALRSSGVVACLAIVTDEVTRGPMAYRMAATEAALAEFNRELFGLNALLVAEDESCAILCTVDLVYLVAGPRPFATAAVGGDIAKARQEFSSFASAEDQPEDLRPFLLDVASRYASFEG